jgi:purine-binding chemotaxis protein CheW
VETSQRTNAIADLPAFEPDKIGSETTGLIETVFTIDAQMLCDPKTSNSACESQDASAEQSKYLVFQVNFCQLAIPLTNLVEVLQETKITRLPNVPRWLLGVSNLRSEIISVVDLRQLLNMDVIHQHRSEAIIVVRSNKRKLVTGLAVDKLSGFKHLHGSESTSRPPLPQYANLPFISQVLQTESQQLAVIDAEQLLGSAEVCRFRL